MYNAIYLLRLKLGDGDEKINRLLAMLEGEEKPDEAGIKVEGNVDGKAVRPPAPRRENALAVRGVDYDVDKNGKNVPRGTFGMGSGIPGM